VASAETVAAFRKLGEAMIEARREAVARAAAKLGSRTEG
jgi:hypothetical protein